MLGFAPLTRDLVADEPSAASLELTLLPFEEIRKIAWAIASPFAPLAQIATVDKPVDRCTCCTQRT